MTVWPSALSTEIVAVAFSFVFISIVATLDAGLGYTDRLLNSLVSTIPAGKEIKGTFTELSTVLLVASPALYSCTNPTRWT